MDIACSDYACLKAASLRYSLNYISLHSSPPTGRGILRHFVNLGYESMIALTFDIDWVPDELIDFLLNLVGRYKVKATIFATHETSLLKNLEPKQFEIAIHPNFLKGGEPEQIVEQLKLLYPQTVGVRAHCLFIHSRLYPIYEKYGLCYSSDYLLYMQPNLAPVQTLCNMIQLPIYFADDFHLMMKAGNENIFEIDCLELQSNGLKIFDFHPIHIFLNTERLDRYENAKKYYHQPEDLQTFRNRDMGTRDLLANLLAYIQQNDIPTYTLGEINNLWRHGKLKTIK